LFFAFLSFASLSFFVTYYLCFFLFVLVSFFLCFFLCYVLLMFVMWVRRESLAGLVAKRQQVAALRRQVAEGAAHHLGGEQLVGGGEQLAAQVALKVAELDKSRKEITEVQMVSRLFQYVE
jgi:hypothetical protein